MLTLKHILIQVCPGDWFLSLNLKNVYFSYPNSPPSQTVRKIHFWGGSLPIYSPSIRSVSGSIHFYQVHGCSFLPSEADGNPPHELPWWLTSFNPVRAQAMCSQVAAGASWAQNQLRQQLSVCCLVCCCSQLLQLSFMIDKLYLTFMTNWWISAPVTWVKGGFLTLPLIWSCGWMSALYRTVFLINRSIMKGEIRVVEWQFVWGGAPVISWRPKVYGLLSVLVPSASMRGLILCVFFTLGSHGLFQSSWTCQVHLPVGDWGHNEPPGEE